MTTAPVQTHPYPLLQSLRPMGTPRQFGSHAVVICLGKSGVLLQNALNQAAQARPTLPQPICLRLGQAGWQRTLPAETDDLPQTNLPEWWESHLPQAQQELQQAYLEALGFTRQMKSQIPESEVPQLNLYLALELLDPVCLELFPQVLELCRETSIAFTHQVITLFLFSDSTRMPHLDQNQASRLRAFRSSLAEELRTSADEVKPTGNVSWCYLVDPMDLNSTPLQPITHIGVSLLQSQVELTADLIMLLTAGLARHPAYQRTSLAHLARDLRNQPKTARVSTFGISSLVMPVAVLVKQAAALLAKMLLEHGLIGSDRLGNLPESRLLLQTWMENCELEKEPLRRELRKDISGEPLSFPVEPPKLSRVPEENIVDTLLNWEEILWQRWTGAASPAARMTENSDRIVRIAAQYLEKRLSDWMEHEVGGAKRCALFIAEAQASLEEEARQIEVEKTTQPHWLTWLLEKLHLPRSAPVSQEDIKQAQHQLERALNQRLNRRAVWMQSSLFAVMLLAFGWAASPYLARILGLESLFAGWLDTLPAQLAEGMGWSVICLIIAYLTGWARILYRQNAIHRATTRMVKTIRARYTDLFEQALSQQQQGIFTALQQVLSGWSQRVDHRLEVLDQAKQMLTARCESLQVELFFNEEILGQMKTAQEILQEAHLPDMADLVKMLLQEVTQAGWENETADALDLRLMAYARHLLKPWLANLDMATWLEEKHIPTTSPVQNASGSRLKQWLDTLRLRARLALPLTREERGPLAAHHMDMQARGLIHIHFAGIPVSPSWVGGTTSPVWNGEVFSTGEAGRLTVLSCLNALNLESLGLWGLLPEPEPEKEGA